MISWIRRRVHSDQGYSVCVCVCVCVCVYIYIQTQTHNIYIYAYTYIHACLGQRGQTVYIRLNVDVYARTHCCINISCQQLYDNGPRICRWSVHKTSVDVTWPCMRRCFNRAENMAWVQVFTVWPGRLQSLIGSATIHFCTLSACENLVHLSIKDPCSEWSKTTQDRWRLRWKVGNQINHHRCQYSHILWQAKARDGDH